MSQDKLTSMVYTVMITSRKRLGQYCYSLQDKSALIFSSVGVIDVTMGNRYGTAVFPSVGVTVFSVETKTMLFFCLQNHSHQHHHGSLF